MELRAECDWKIQEARDRLEERLRTLLRTACETGF